MMWPRADQFCVNTRLVFRVEGRIGEELVLAIVRMFLVCIEKHVVIAHVVELAARSVKLEEK